MNLFKKLTLFICAFSFLGMLVTSCDIADRKKDSKEYQEGDADDSDLFAIPFDSSGPSDERVLDRLEDAETEK